MSSGAGNDNVGVRDGFADRVACGPGADTVTADTLDVVSDTCEGVNRADVGNANEDRPPAVEFTAPTGGATMSTSRPNALSATASDDRGVARVLFLDDERIVCSDASAPYTCAYTPRDQDIGRNTLAVMAVDTSEQTATAFRPVSVPLFTPRSLGAKTTKRDRKAPFAFTTSGSLALPPGVSRGSGCNGRVTVQIKSGRKSVSKRTVRLSRRCRYRSSVRFRRLRAGKLSVTARFGGNRVLKAKSAKRSTVRAG